MDHLFKANTNTPMAPVMKENLGKTKNGVLEPLRVKNTFIRENGIFKMK